MFLINAQRRLAARCCSKNKSLTNVLFMNEWVSMCVCPCEQNVNEMQMLGCAVCRNVYTGLSPWRLACYTPSVCQRVSARNVFTLLRDGACPCCHASCHGERLSPPSRHMGRWCRSSPSNGTAPLSPRKPLVARQPAHHL